MKIVCLVKLVPDVESFKYDYERNVLVRDNVQLQVNPEDATALAIALAFKSAHPETRVEVVTMAPRAVMPHLQDLVRRGVDGVALISDSSFVGSDTWVTSRILARYLEGQTFDCVFSGTHSLDGGTAHVPAQVAECLGFAQMSNVSGLEPEAIRDGRAVVDVESERATLTFDVPLPALIGFAYSTAQKVPYIPYEMLDVDVSDRIRIVTNDDLGFDRSEVGLDGSLTRVAGVEVHKFEQKETVFVRADDAGIERVYQYLVQGGYVAK